MGAASAAQRPAGLPTTYQPFNPDMNKVNMDMTKPGVPAQTLPAQNGIQPLAAGGQNPYLSQNVYQGMPAQNGIQPLGAPVTGPGSNPYGAAATGGQNNPYLSQNIYQQPYPQPAQYLPFGSATTMGPTDQHPDMRNFNFMSPGGGNTNQQQTQQTQQAQQQTNLSRILDQFLGANQGRQGYFGKMGVPGLGGGSLSAIDTGVMSGALPRDYRVPFRNQVGVGFGTPTFNS